MAKKGSDAEAARPLDNSAQRTVVDIDRLDGPVQFVLLCPNTSARLELGDLRLEPARTPIPAPASAWAWEPARWRDTPAALLDHASARGIRRLYISLEIATNQVRNAQALAGFIRAAGARGIAVEVVEGDPRMVNVAGRARALTRARAIAAYQRAVPPDARLAGVQYDIEPYVLPEFSSQRSTVLEAWSQTIAELAQAVGQKLDVVLPFWIADQPDGEAALNRVARHLSGATVMAYRTDSAEIGLAAEPILAWGARRNVPVRVALEMARLDDESEVRYRPGDGALGLLAVGKGGALLKLRDGLQHREATPLAAVGTTKIPADRLSFQGNEAAMLATADRLRAAFSAWPSFTGFAFHGLL